MSGHMHVDFHTCGPTPLQRGTAVEVHTQTDCVVIRIGDGGALPPLAIYVDRPAEAFALAQAFAAAGQVLEQRAGQSRVSETPAEGWTEPPLPLHMGAPTSMACSEDCVRLGCLSERCAAF